MRPTRAVSIAVCASLTSGCAVKEPKPVQAIYRAQEDAGTVEIAVQSVAPFEEYVDQLQPRFTLTADAAYQAAITDTQLEELRALRSLAFSLGISFPTVTLSRSSTTTTENGASKTTSSETKSRASGAPPNAPEPPTGSLPEAFTVQSGLGVDAALRYRAASALMQEVALLSTYVKDAAVRANTIPFVVRLLATVFPSSRRAPYDVYSAIAFFATDPKPTVYGRGGFEEYARIYNTGDPPLEALRQLAHSPRCEGEPVEVVPLFVTDNVESSVLTSGRENQSGLGVGLSGTVANLGVSASGRSKTSASVRTAGRDLNSLVTIGRASANTLEARFGAAAVEGTYQTQPRTYSVTALTLMPTTELPNSDLALPCRSVRFTARSAFRHADTGTELPSASASWLGEEAVKTLSDVGLAVAPIYSKNLSEALFEGTFDHLAAIFPPAERRAAIAPLQRAWPRLVSLTRRTGQSAGSFEVPVGGFRFFYSPRPGDAPFPLLDNDETAELFMSGATGLRGDAIIGRLEFDVNGKKIALQSDVATVTDNGRTVRVRFRSPKKTTGLDVKVADVELAYRPPEQRWHPTQDSWTWKQVNTPIVYGIKPANDPKPEFTIATASPYVIVDESGSAQVRVEIRRTGKTAHKVHFLLEGAHVASAVPPLGTDGADYLSDVDRAYVLQLDNVLPGSIMKLRSWRMDGDKKVAAADVPVLAVSVAHPVEVLRR
jgi:hypothetical protein